MYGEGNFKKIPIISKNFRLLRKDIHQWNKNLMQLDTCIFREKYNTLGMEANVMEISQRRENFWIKNKRKR